MKKTRRDFIRSLSAAAALATLSPLKLLAAGEQAPARKPTAIDPMSLVNPELRPALQAMLKAGPMPKLPANVSLSQILDFRRATDHPVQFLPQPAVTERMVPVAKGAPDVRIYIINSTPGTTKPAILHMHGGGYIIGTARGNVPSLQRMARTLDCVIVTVEYRLAPEAHFPASLNENYAALKYLHTNARTLGVDPTRIAITGESAGGGHAAMLAIHARNRSEVPILFQSLVYPMLDDRTGSTRNPAPYIGTFTWNRDYNRLGWSSLLGKLPATSPSREPNLSGLPPTWLGVGSLDLFIDEDLDFAHRLIDSGIPTELLVIPGAYHGFDNIAPTASVSKEFTRSRLTALARAFGTKLL